MFFFKQKTAYEMRISDWSSDVCSSDLVFSLARQALFAAGLFTFAAPVAASSPEQQFGAVADLLSAGKADDAMQTLAQLNAQSPDFHLGRQFYEELKIGRASWRERVCQNV